MRTKVPEKLLAIVEAVRETGSANMTRMTVLKKWFERPGRPAAFGAWAAGRASARKGKTLGEAGALFDEARMLLKGVHKVRPELDRRAAEDLQRRLRDFQNEHERQAFGSVRIIKNWNLLLVEQGLALYLDGAAPERGYELAADFCKQYDSRFADSLTAKSVAKLLEIMRWMYTMEALEDEE